MSDNRLFCLSCSLILSDHSERGMTCISRGGARYVSGYWLKSRGTLRPGEVHVHTETRSERIIEGDYRRED